MSSRRHPLDWFIEVCGVCGCQLGPGIGSRTSTGRCIEESHRSTGGVVIRVIARPAEQQESLSSTQRLLRDHPEFCNAERRAREPEAMPANRETVS